LLINQIKNIYTLKRLSLGLIGILIFTNCVTSKKVSPTEVKVLSVNSQKYRGGVKGSPSGVKYKLILIAPANQNEFKSIGFWIEDKFAPAQAYLNKLGVNRSQFIKGDTLVVSANFIQTANGYMFQDTSVNLIKPVGYNEKVLLAYTLQNKKMYVGVNKIDELQEELRP